MVRVVFVSQESNFHDGEIVDWASDNLSTAELSKVNGHFLFGRGKVDPLHLPRTLELFGNPRTVLPWFWTSCSMMVCSARVREIISRLDPSAHQWFDLSIRGAAIGDIEAFGLHVFAERELVDMNNSNIKSLSATVSVIKIVNFPERRRKLVVAAHDDESPHLWREKNLSRSLLMSDRLYKDLSDENLINTETWRATVAEERA